MQLRYDVQLRAMIKSLSEVVLPAVDPENELALEQVQIAIGLLALMEQRLPLQFRYDCDELERAIDLADQLREQCAGDRIADSSEVLRDTVARARDVRARAQAGPDEVYDAIRELRETSAATVTDVYRNGTEATRRKLTRTVTANAAAQLLRERAWVLPQGWEAEPGRLPPIEDLI